MGRLRTRIDALRRAADVGRPAGWRPWLILETRDGGATYRRDDGPMLTAGEVEGLRGQYQLVVVNLSAGELPGGSLG